MYIKTNRTKTITSVKRLFVAYNSEDKEILTSDNIAEFSQKLNVNHHYIYTVKNTGKFIKSDLGNVRIDYVKSKHTETITKILPFIIPIQDRETIEDLPGEVWKSIPGCYEGNLCSNKGRFKIRDIEGNETFSTILKSKNRTNRTYTDVTIISPDTDTSFKCRTSRALAKTFLDESFPLTKVKDEVVDHIDNDSTNECIENLRILKQSENIRAAMDMGKTIGLPEKACVAYNVKTGEVRNYKNTRELCEDIWKSKNTGYFNHAYNCKTKTRDGWRVGFTLEEIKKDD